MQNKYFFTKMQQFITELFWAFAGKPFEIYTTNVMEDKIRCEQNLRAAEKGVG